DRARHAFASARERDRLSVVARRRRDDAETRVDRVARQAANQVQPAADLERIRRVVVLVLDEDVEPRFLRKERMAKKRRRLERAVNARPGGVDVLQRRYVHRTNRIMTSGRSVINASTPQPRRRRALASSFTVHTCT